MTIRANVANLTSINVNEVGRVLTHKVLRSLGLHVKRRPYRVLGAIINGQMANQSVSIRLLYRIAMARIRDVTLLTIRLQVALTSMKKIHVVRVEVREPSSQAVSARIMSWARVKRVHRLMTSKDKERCIIGILYRVLATTRRVLRVLSNVLMTWSRATQGSLRLRSVSRVNNSGVIRVLMI